MNGRVGWLLLAAVISAVVIVLWMLLHSKGG